MTKHSNTFDTFSEYQAAVSGFSYPHLSLVLESGGTLIYDSEAEEHYSKSVTVTNNENQRGVQSGFMLEGFHSDLDSYDFTMKNGNDTWDVSITHDDRFGDWTLTITGDDGILYDAGFSSFDNEDEDANYMVLNTNDTQSYEWSFPAELEIASDILGDYKVYNMQYTVFDLWLPYVIPCDIPYVSGEINSYSYTVHVNNYGEIDEYSVQFDFNASTGEIQNVVADDGIEVRLLLVNNDNTFNAYIAEGETPLGWEECKFISVIPNDSQSDYGYIVNEE